MEKDEKMFEELFTPPHRDKIIKELPTFFNVVEKESLHGTKVGMEVGALRKQIIIGLFMHVYSRDAVSFPEKESPEKAISVNGEPISIKTKTGKGCSGVKVTWTGDWDKEDEFVSSFVPQSHLLFINVHWEGVGGFFLITKETQKEVFNSLGRDSYFNSPPHGSNSRGIPMSSKAMRRLQEHGDTQIIDIAWERDNTIPAGYEKWCRSWEKMS